MVNLLSMSNHSEGEPSGEGAERDQNNELRKLAKGELETILARHAGWRSIQNGRPLSECLGDGDLDPQEWAEEARTNPQIADLSGVDLFEADLSGVNLFEADLRGAKLDSANLTGAELGFANLRGANLYGADLRGAKLFSANLSTARLTEADLRGAKLESANLTGAELSRANLGGAQLNWANLSMANLSLAKLNSAYLMAANLSGANFGGANLSMANLSGADLSGANLSGVDLRDAKVHSVKLDHAQMRHRYGGIRGIDTCYGNALFKRYAADQDFLDTLEASWRCNPWKRFLFWVWGRIDYGRSLSRIFMLAVGLVVFFGVIYSSWPQLLGYPTWDSKVLDRFTPFYFSIVTYTTLGFGDINPKGHVLGEIIVSIEVVLGYCTLGLLLSVLAEKIARRS
jgi:uncharacterized protein YjbI with pentapeptide repeats